MGYVVINGYKMQILFVVYHTAFNKKKRIAT